MNESVYVFATICCFSGGIVVFVRKCARKIYI